MACECAINFTYFLARLDVRRVDMRHYLQLLSHLTQRCSLNTLGCLSCKPQFSCRDSACTEVRIFSFASLTPALMRRSYCGLVYRPTRARSLELRPALALSLASCVPLLCCLALRLRTLPPALRIIFESQDLRYP